MIVKCHYDIGYFALVSAMHGEKDKDTAIVSKPFTNTDVQYTCMKFWFNIKVSSKIMYTGETRT